MNGSIISWYFFITLLVYDFLLEPALSMSQSPTDPFSETHSYETDTESSSGDRRSWRNHMSREERIQELTDLIQQLSHALNNCQAEQKQLQEELNSIINKRQFNKVRRITIGLEIEQVSARLEQFTDQMAHLEEELNELVTSSETTYSSSRSSSVESLPALETLSLDSPRRSSLRRYQPQRSSSSHRSQSRRQARRYSDK